MLTRRAVLPVVFLCFLLVPTAYAFTIDGPINWVYENGGNIRYNITITTTEYTTWNTLSRFQQLRTGAPLLGNLAFNCQNGVNMTITSITDDTVTYLVETAAPGAVSTYLYYSRNIPTYPVRRPAEVAGGTLNYNTNTGIATIRTTGASVPVTVTYTYDVADIIIEQNMSLIQVLTLITIVSAFIYVGGAKSGLSNEYLIRIVLIIAAFMMVAYLAQGWGF